MKLRLIAYFLIIIFTITFSEDIEDSQKKLKEIRSDLQKLENEKKEYEEKEISIIEEINYYDKRIYLMHQVISESEKQQLIINRRIIATMDKIEETKVKIKQMQNELAKSLRLLYVYKDENLFEQIIKSGSYNNFVKQKHFHKIISNNKELILKNLESFQLAEHKLHNKLLDDKNNLLSLVDRKKSTIKKMENQKNERNTYIEEIKTEKKKIEMKEDELRKFYDEIEEEIAAIIREKAKTEVPIEFDLEKKFLWPIDGKIVRKFGKIKHPIYKTFINNKGIGIDISKDNKVKATLSGNIMFVDWIRGRGLTIIIEHSKDLYTVYGNIMEAYVDVGNFVSQSDNIGLVGNFGNNEESYLYFEIRKNNKAINPTIYLK